MTANPRPLPLAPCHSNLATPPWRVPGRIAYIVSHSYPYSSNGYAVRTHGVATGLQQHGHSVIVINRPGRPWDISGFDNPAFPLYHDIDGVRYFVLSEPSARALTPEDWQSAAAEALQATLRVFKPSVVMAASNWENALPALTAARALGLPFFYEVRGFWEITRASREPDWAQSSQYRHAVERETWIAQQAERVFTLNALMRDELVRRGVPAERIALVPNGVGALPDLTRAPTLTREALGIKSRYVAGYVGSFNPYEGLEDLIRAAAQLVQSGLDLSLLLVGSASPLHLNGTCPEAQRYRQLAQELGFAERLILPGRVAPDRLSGYYGPMDLVVIPRQPLPVAELVSPIKPLEATAHGKALLLSDVAPLAEFAQEAGAAVFRKGDVAHLAEQMRGLLTDEARRRSMGERARDWVETQCQFRTNVEPITFDAGRLSPFDLNQHPTQNKAKRSAPVEKNLQLGVLNQPESVELPQKDPLWYSIPVRAGQSLMIEAAVEYRNIKAANNRKAALLINSFDANGKEVDKPCGKLSKSGHLKGYFKYLSCTQNQLQELHTFTVPEGISEIRLGLCGFNKKDAEQVLVQNLSVRPKPDKSQPTPFVPPSAQAAEISILGWPEYPPNGKPYVIGIMDEFTTGCFEEELNLIQPRPDNWYALAEKYKPALFFIESAWKGNFGSWQYRVADYANKPGQEVEQLCQYAREQGIPTLFWNKEDPVHHDKFLCSAKLVDYIFTTDANMKDSYQAKTGNLNVQALPFAAQPALHKPAPLAGRKPRACFAGSWYGNRHAERGEAMRWLLQAANRHGLDIYDRNHGTGTFPFPEEYQAGIKGRLPYKTLCDEYSRYRVFLNVNSVTDSPTMFSRRVFELMACGTPVVSTYAKGIENLFESGAVWLVNSQAEADEAIRTLMTDDAEWRRRSLAGIREVFARHTYAHRLNDIFDRLGIETRIPTDPGLVLVAEAQDQAELEALNRFALKQSYRAFRLGVICGRGFAPSADSLSGNMTLLHPGQTAAWIRGAPVDCPLAGWVSPRGYYGEHYLRDLANASLYVPEAGGWAKALDRDRFAYGGQVSVSGVLWKRAEFLRQSIELHPDEHLTRADLYLADSDQFQSVRVVRPSVA